MKCFSRQDSNLITREHNGHSFTFREDGYFNMTKAAKHYGKKLDNFWNLRDTKHYVEALENSLDFRVIEARCGGKGSEAGTWAHPKLAVFFARWLDVRFAVWCDLMIDEILRGRVLVAPIPEDHPPIPQDPPRAPEPRESATQTPALVRIVLI